MASLGNKLATPALIPWMPPGKPKESSSNVLVHKKNSGSYDYGSSIASSTVFNQPNKKKLSLEQKFWSPKKNSRKLTLGPEKERRIETLLKSSVNSQAEQDVLRNKIMEIFDEAEENEKELNEKKNKNRRRHNSDPENNSKNRKHEDGDDKTHKKRSRSRSIKNKDNNEFQEKDKNIRDTSPSVERNKSRNKYSSRNHSGRRRNDESTKNSTNNSVHTPSNDKQFLKSTKENDSKGMHKKNNKTNRSTNDSEESSGIGSLGYIEDLEDRNSIKFIDSYDMYAPNRGIENSDLGYYETSEINNYQEEIHDIFIDDIERDPRYHHISSEVEVQTEPFPDPNNKPTLIHAMPNIIFDQEAPYHNVRQTQVNNSVASSRMGFTNVPLRHRDDPHSSLPEAWLVYPKGQSQVERSLGIQSRNVESILSVPRSYTAKPINFAASLGSRLKQSFANINSINPSITPVEQFVNSDQENLVDSEPELTEEEKQEKRKQSARNWGAGACCGLILLVAIIVGIALLATILGPASKYDEGTNPTPQRFRRNNDTSMCFNYKNLTDPWRKITGKPPSDGIYHCDANSDGFQKPGWYRFSGDAGKHLATSPPSFVGEQRTYKEVCGTTKVGWMKGSHPTINDGVQERTFCFQSKGGECQYEETSKVRTCPVEDEYTVYTKTFYVYHLKIPPLMGCHFAYCAVVK